MSALFSAIFELKSPPKTPRFRALFGPAALLFMLAAICFLGGCHESAEAAIRRQISPREVKKPACSADFVGLLADVKRYQKSPNRARQKRAARALSKLRESARDRSAAWLQLVPYQPASTAQRPALAILSFPGSANSLARRSYVYDMALALLWFSWTGQDARARGIAQTLSFLQKDDGSWGFSFHVDHAADYHDRYIRNGTVAWAAHALTYFATQYADPAALVSARRAAQFLRSMQLGSAGPNRGLVSAGLGLPGTLADEPPSAPVEFAPAEHQFDAQIVFSALDPPAARRLSERIIDVLWMGGEGRFALAAGPRRVDTRRALDAAGAWGALWLLADGQPERARRSFEYARETFATDDTLWDTRFSAPKTLKLQGFRPYEDDIDGYDVDANIEHFFLEGTFSMGVAAHRLGASQAAESALITGVALSCAESPGVVYSNVELPGFLAEPAAASTLWFLFLEREMAGAPGSPIFPAQPAQEESARAGALPPS